MTGRTLGRWMTVYIDGYRMAGYTSKITPLGSSVEEQESLVISDAVVGNLLGHFKISPPTLTGVFDADTSLSLKSLFSAGDALKHVMVAIGDKATPAAGVPCYATELRQKPYQAVGDGAMAATVEFAGWDTSAATLLYGNPLGVLVHADGAETGVNAGTGIDNDTAGATTKGGYMAYQLFSSDGTVNLKIDDSANNSAFTALSGAATGLIDASVTPAAGIIALGTTATVRRYLRWQLALGTASTATFALAFVRNFTN